MNENLQKLRDLALQLIGQACQCDVLNGYSCSFHGRESDVHGLADAVHQYYEHREQQHRQQHEEEQGTIEVLEEKVSALKLEIQELDAKIGCCGCIEH